MPVRILFVDLAPVPYGSVISLYHLVKGMHRDYVPVLLLAQQNSYVERFRDLGLEVHTVISPQGRGVIYAPSIELARRGRLGDWMRTHPPASSIWHCAGFCTRFFRRLLPQALQRAHLMKSWRVALVHVNDAPSINQANILAARLAGLPVICHVRNFEQPLSYTQWLSRQVAAYICISQAVQHNLEALGFYLRRSYVVPNGLDLSEFPGWATKDGRQKTEDLPSSCVIRPLSGFGWPPESLIVGSIGRLVDWKGHDVFLRALAQVRRTLPQVRGLVVGGEDPSEPDCLQRLQALARELGLADVVIFTGHRQDATHLMAGMDVIVHAAKAPEPFGRVIIEGMAACRPVIATAAGGVPEIIQDGATGCLIPPGNAEAMAAAMIAVLTHPEAARAMALAGRREVEQRYTTQKAQEGVLRVYDEIVPLLVKEER